jgi:hypothetical protein
MKLASAQRVHRVETTIYDHIYRRIYSKDTGVSGIARSRLQGRELRSNAEQNFTPSCLFQLQGDNVPESIGPHQIESAQLQTP